MAGSSTRPNADRIAVAVSGGRDSTALLHCTARAARDAGLEVHALHVHHGLHPAADDWLARLRARCARWRRAGLPVTLHARRLDGCPPPGDSVEAWARQGRYRLLDEMAGALGCRVVLLAQHRRDQAETLLLQALRGGGPRGLAAMPAASERAGRLWLRPWLAQSRDAIEAYVARHRLGYVDDASNDDERFARNRLRRRVWPALIDAFPDAEATLARAAARAHEAAVCLRLLAAQDAEAVLADGSLDQAAWLRLDPSRRANLLRHWQGGPRRVGAHLPDSLVQRLLDELPAARHGQWPAPAACLQLYRGRLHWRPGPAVAPRPVAAPEQVMDLHRPGRYDLPAGQGSLVVRRATQGGVRPDLLRAVRLAPRAGGERFQASGAAPPRSLKKQFQSAGVPGWARRGPLVWAADGALLFVPGLGVDARVRAPGGTAQLALQWVPAGGD
jgi:tRNA(Ile)-lysidine synthase